MYFVNNRRALDEIVFRGRNKSYGAYVLRTEYERTLFKALFLVILGVTMLTGIGWLLSRTVPDAPSDIIQIIPDLLEVPVNLEPEPEKKSPPAQVRRVPPPQNNNSAAPLFTVVAEDDLKKDTTNTSTAEPTLPQTANGTGLGAVTTATSAGTGGNGIEDSRPLELHEAGTLPEFEGGLKALRDFIAQNVVYPRQEAELGNSGLVMVRFVVDEKGQISNVTIKHSAGNEFDKEAARVVRLLPGFKTPGKIGGRAVKVFYELPIKFRIR